LKAVKAWGDGKLSSDEKYGRRHQITFRITAVAEDRLRRAAILFDLKPSELAKRLVYMYLQVFDEPPDRRRRSWKQKKQLENEEGDL
jgi:hypothetical protein